MHDDSMTALAALFYFGLFHFLCSTGEPSTLLVHTPLYRRRVNNEEEKQGVQMPLRILVRVPKYVWPFPSLFSCSPSPQAEPTNKTEQEEPTTILLLEPFLFPKNKLVLFLPPYAGCTSSGKEISSEPLSLPCESP